MDDIVVWHNPKCSKSRGALDYLQEKEVTPTVVRYMDKTITKSELKKILKLLKMSARQLMRTKESVYKELNLDAQEDENALIEAMIAHPKLIERPIVIRGNKAVVARPLENIDAIL